MNTRPYTAVLLIPTGIGAAIGGYAGDAIPVVRLLSQVCDRLMTHPNALNGAQLYWPLPNVLYVEGYGLDQFAAGTWGLRPGRANRIGLLLDQAIEPDLRLRHLQAAEAARATLGLTLTDYVITDAPLGVSLKTAASGATWGTLAQPDSLLRAAEKLVQQAGATAIAVVARFPDTANAVTLQQYRHGQGVDPLAGAEAVISHLVVRYLQVPCAHAPALQPLPLDADLSPRAAAEELGYTFLPSVLVGLSRAPQFTLTPQSGDLTAADVDAVIVPATACGGSALLHLSQIATVIAVRENTTTMQVLPAALGIKAITVNTYLEAAGVVAAHQAGISLADFYPGPMPLRPLP